MKPPRFTYHRPGSLDEALHVIAEHGDSARPLAGGQSLVPLLATRSTRPAHLVDLQRVDAMRGISVSDGRVRIGAMTRQRDVERDPRMPGLVRAAVPHIGTFQIRNRGTVGGSLAYMDPAAEWPAVALVSGAVMVAASREGRREIPADAFMTGPHQTALRADELLIEVVLPRQEVAFGFAEVTRRGVGDLALAGAACQGGVVVVFGAGPRPQRLPEVEELLTGGQWTRDAVEAVAAAAIDARSDMHAPADYRRRVAAALVARVVQEASSGGRGGPWS